MSIKSNGRAGVRAAAPIAFVLALVLYAAAAHATAALASPEETVPVSVDEGGEFADGAIGNHLAVSADGRYVALTSTARNLTADSTESAQVYVKDLETGAVTLASRAAGAAGEPADAPALEPCSHRAPEPSISADGRYVTFGSSADNLVPGLPVEEEAVELECAQIHAYRRDLRTGQTEMVDRVAGSGAIVGHEARPTAISGDGRYVLFSDQAEGLEEEAGSHEASGRLIAYLRDMETETTTVVSRASGSGGALADRDAEGLEFSPDGGSVIFTSTADNLVTTAEPVAAEELYRRELQPPFATELLSQSNDGAPASQGMTAISAAFLGTDGCAVAFASSAQNLVAAAPPRGAYLRDRCAAPPSTTLMEIGEPDEEGEAFSTTEVAGATRTGEVAVVGTDPLRSGEHLYLFDPASGSEVLVDRASGPDGAIADASVEAGAAISADGCRAVFLSGATNLGATPPAAAPEQVFARQVPCEEPPAQEGPAQLEPAQPDAAAPASSPASVASDGVGGARAVAPAKTVRLAESGPRSVRLVFDGAGRSRIRIQRLISGREHRGWRLVRTLIATAEAAGPVEVEMAALPPGRYRIKFRLQGDPDNPTMSGRLRI